MSRKGSAAVEAGWNIERPIRKLTDSELASLAKDAPSHEAYRVRAILGTHLNVVRGYDYCELSIHNEICDRALSVVSQQLLWKGLEMMTKFQTPAEYATAATFPQLSIF